MHPLGEPSQKPSHLHAAANGPSGAPTQQPCDMHITEGTHGTVKDEFVYQEAWGQPWPIILRQLQSVRDEQASLQALLRLQHKQLLQRLSSSSCSAILNAHNGSAEPHAHSKASFFSDLPNAPREMQVMQNGTTCTNSNSSEAAQVREVSQNGLNQGNSSASHSLSTSHTKPSRKQTALALASGKGHYIDVSKLPSDWGCYMYDTHVSSKSNAPTWLKFGQDVVQSGKFDAIFSIVILINLITVCIQLQWRGYYAATLMGVDENDHGWLDAKKAFELLEYGYTTIFAIEALLRVSFLGRQYLRVPANLLDTVIVWVTAVQMYILQPFDVMKDASFVAVARLIRLVRILRFLKVVRYAAACRELRILTKALAGCMGSLFWSMIFVASIILAGGIILYQLVLSYLEDDTNSLTSRQWCYENFGTIALCMMALWEVTFSGSWHRYTYKMIVDMGPVYALFWVPYVVCINFAVMRLVGALFLKQTMAVAAAETEKMSMVKLKNQLAFADQIRDILASADQSGDGKISSEEFEAMLTDKKVGSCFEKLELDVSEVVVLFELLAADTGYADYHEFMDGVLKLKQTTQTIDTIQLIHSGERLSTAIQTVYEGLRQVAKATGVTLTTTTDNCGYCDHHGHMVSASCQEDRNEYVVPASL